MDDDESLDIIVNRLCIGRDCAHIVVLGEFRERGPALGRTLAHLHHHRIRLAADNVGERSHHADDRTLGPRNARDEARQVVFKRRLRAGRKDAKRLLAVAAHCDDAEVNPRAKRIAASLRLYAIALRPLLGVGVWLRVISLDDKTTTARALVFLEEIPDLRRVCLERHRHLSRRGADVVLERDVLCELGEHRLGALRERVELLRGHVAPERQVRKYDDGRRCDRADENETDDALRRTATAIGDGLRRSDHEDDHREVVADIGKVYDALSHRLEVRQ